MYIQSSIQLSVRHAHVFSSLLHHSIFHLKPIKKTVFDMIHLRTIHFDDDKKKIDVPDDDQ